MRLRLNVTSPVTKCPQGAKEVFRQLLAGNREQTETAAAIIRES